MQSTMNLMRLGQNSRLRLAQQPPLTKVQAAKGFGKAAPVKKPVVQQAETIVDPCPCESRKNYKNCCERVHTGEKQAATPEAALRARFSAYIRSQPEHIIETTHPDYFPYHYSKPRLEVADKFADDVNQACTKFVYADFKIVQTEPGSHEDEGFVAFSYKFAPRPADEAEVVPDDAWSMTDEKCRFLRVNGRWNFVDYQSYSRNLAQLVQKVEAQQK